MRRVNSEAYSTYVEDPAYAGQDADNPDKIGTNKNSALIGCAFPAGERRIK
ncbi:hypothetical protein ASZ90_008004 [hydrocarbon metagenome]|uniref:Uncharacterized protein n=1 Tax=hydrocarbon metagenome TaxID=938273 RepID=A0A0W8FN26_9ZZZZ